jgi:alpha-methylacyl-CoA racemase
LFLKRMGLQADSDFANQHERSNWPALTARLAALFVSQSRAHWTAVFAGSDACAGPVLNPEEAMAETHMQARAVWSAPKGRLQAAAAPRFDGAVPAPPPTSPQRDQDRDAILSELAQLERAGR